jgi:hypothetical protein
MANSYQLNTTRNLPDHHRVLKAVLGFFEKTAGTTGAYLSGSTAAGRMDEDSDLDVGVLFSSPASRQAAWEKRWDWEIAPWFHRFDADHIKPYFVIYFFEPLIKADINLYIASDLPPYEGGPYEVLWDDIGELGYWQEKNKPSQDLTPDWSNVVHEDERFWAWMLYLYSHVHRGEYYHTAGEFPALRDILEQWAARLAGQTGFKSRYLEEFPYADPLFENNLFPKPDLESLKVSMQDAMAVQIFLRRKISQQLGVGWITTDGAIEKIASLVGAL